MRFVVYWIAMVGAVALVAASCGANEDDPGPAAPVEVTEGSDDPSSGTSVDSSETAEGSPIEGEDARPPAGDGGGTLVLGEETISFDNTRCFLQEQDAAAGGGKILFVAQAFGTNADGDELLIDVSRYDEDSRFAGDDIVVDIGDPFSAEAVSWRANAELGTIQVDGSTVSADGLTFVNFDDFSEMPGSFRISC